MAESYFKDPLLAKWAEHNSDETTRYLADDHRDANAVGMLDTIDAMPRPFSTDRERLRALILAELSGARRARERAEQLKPARGDLDEPWERGVTFAATEILEAFDGE